MAQGTNGEVRSENDFGTLSYDVLQALTTVLKWEK